MSPLDLDPEAIVDRIQESLVRDAPAGFLATLMGSERLQAALVAFRDVAVSGLRDRAPDLEHRLGAAKTAVMAALPDSHYTLERLLARAVQEVVAAARGGAVPS